MRNFFALLLALVAGIANAQLAPSKLVATDASNHLTAYAGTTPAACSNQFLRQWTLSAAGVGGTSCATASLTTDVSGILPLANGGTAANNAATSGTFLRGNGTAFVTSTLTLPNASTSGGVLYSSAADTIATSGALGSTQIVLGGGAGAAPNASANLAYTSSMLNVNTPSAALAVAALRVAYGNTIIFAGESTLPSGSGAGAFAGLYSNDGAAMANGDRLGGFLLGGSSSASALRNSVLIAAFASEAWVDGSAYGSKLDFEVTPNASTTRAAKMRLLGSGRLAIGSTIFDPTATLHLAAGTTAASTAPLKFTSGSLLTTAEAGAVEYLTDKYYGTITTGAARKEFTLNDAALTSGALPVATTNGRLTDSTLTQSGTALTAGTNAATATNLTLNAAGGTGQGAYYVVSSAGVAKSYFGAKAVIFGSGTDQSLLLHSVADNAILNAASGKTASLSVNFSNVVAATSTGAAVTGTLQVSSGGSANKAVCWKSGTTLGFCSTVVAADGSCTCN